MSGVLRRSSEEDARCSGGIRTLRISTLEWIAEGSDELRRSSDEIIGSCMKLRRSFDELRRKRWESFSRGSVSELVRRWRRHVTKAPVDGARQLETETA